MANFIPYGSTVVVLLVLALALVLVLMGVRSVPQGYELHGRALRPLHPHAAARAST